MDSGDKSKPTASRVVPFKKHTRLQDQELFHACWDRANRCTRALLEDAIDHACQAFVERANKGAADGSGARFYDAIHQLGVHRSTIAAQFSAAFKKRCVQCINEAYQRGSSRVNGSADATAGLSLVDEAELEESLAIDSLTAKAKDRLSGLLYPLEQRLNEMAKGGSIDEKTNPLGPSVICNAMRDALKPVTLEIEPRLLVYKIFDQHLLKSLPSAYEEINNLMLSAGILPHLKPTVTRPGQIADGASTRKSADKSHELKADSQGSNGRQDLEDPESADVFQTLQHLLNVRKYGSQDVSGNQAFSSASFSPGTAGAAIASIEELFAGLTAMQHGAADSDAGGAAISGPMKTNIASVLSQLGGNSGAKTLNPVHDNTIDVIGMIFEFILDEPSIPDKVKSLLTQLQIPIVKVAILDHEFFSKKLHPARRLLNSLGHASIGWHDHDENEQCQRFEKMQYVVNRILSEFETETGIFSELLQEFTDFMDQGHGGAEPELETPPGDGAEKISADQRAFEVIEEILDCAELPGLARNFLRAGWRDVLAATLEADGENSSMWDYRRKFVDDLIWSFEPKVTAEDRRRFVVMLPILLDTLGDGMELIACPKEDIDKIIQSFETIHFVSLRGEKYIESQESAAATTPEEAGEQASPDNVADMIRSIREGMEKSNNDLLNEEMSDETDWNDLFGQESATTDAASDDEEDADLDEQIAIDDEYTEMAMTMKTGTWLEFRLGDKTRRGKLAWKSAVLGQYVFVNRKYKVIAEKTVQELAADLRSSAASVVENVAMFDRALDSVINGLMGAPGSRA